MIKKITALTFIFVCTALAWMILGTTLQVRSNDYNERLGYEVDSLYGPAQYQEAPNFNYSYNVDASYFDEKLKKKVNVTKSISGTLPIESSDINVDLSLDYRKKGLLWYSTYVVDFDGTYTTKNNIDKKVDLYIFYKFPSSRTEYDDFHFYINGEEMEKLNWGGEEGVGKVVELEPNEELTFRIVYTSHGKTVWAYKFGKETVEVKDFSMTITTDFMEVDFPEGSISPTSKEENDSGMVLTWDYMKKISGATIAIEMPRKLNPGPLAARITYFAPVSLFFFFFIMFMITTLKEIRIHPVNFFFLACAFFAFHLLFAYLVDHLNVNLSFIISAVVSVFLVVSYLRLVVGPRFAFVEAGISQIVYLVLFSYSFFFKGYTGLIITISSIITLAILMQMTGRIDWDEKFRTLSRKEKAVDDKGLFVK